MSVDRNAARAERIVYAVAFVGATLLHVLVGVALGTVDPSTARAVRPEPGLVELVPIEPAVVEEEPEPTVEAPPEPEPSPRERPPAREAREEPPPPSREPPPPAEEQVLDFSNTTLLSNSPSSFQMQQSSGAESDRIGRPGVEATGRRREGVPGGTPGGTGDGPPQPVAASDLREPPRPPANLDSVLRRFYPSEAQAQGIEARVVARFVILADGRPTAIRIGRESEPGYGFGAACRRAIEEAGRWSAPVGPDGRPTATRFSMSCYFDIR